MVVLRFKDRSPREFKVPFNIRIRNVDVPVGLGIIFVIMFLSALANLLTKQVATISGLIFTAGFLVVFIVTERYYERKRRGAKHEHIEQFNKQSAQDITAKGLGLTRRYRKLVAIRSVNNLFMLEKTLLETDPLTTDVIVMTAKVLPKGGESGFDSEDLDAYDRHLMTAVVDRAERAGKKVTPLIIPTNNPLHAVLLTAKQLNSQEIVVGASNKFTAEVQLDQIAFYWINLHDGKTPGLTVRILGRDRDVYYDLEGGNRIPKIGERQARSVAELRASGFGVKRVLMLHDGTLECSDLFDSVLTMLDPDVQLNLVSSATAEQAQRRTVVEQDQQQASRLGRKLQVRYLNGQCGSEIVQCARDGECDLLIIGLPEKKSATEHWPEWLNAVLNQARCTIFLASRPVLPQEMAD